MYLQPRWFKVCIDATTLMDNKQKLANEFNEFFCKKVHTIMDNLQPIEETDIEPHYIKTEYLMNCRFKEFETIDENTVLKLIKKSATKSCESDMILTNLFKEYADVLVPKYQLHNDITVTWIFYLQP